MAGHRLALRRRRVIAVAGLVLALITFPLWPAPGAPAQECRPFPDDIPLQVDPPNGQYPGRDIHITGTEWVGIDFIRFWLDDELLGFAYGDFWGNLDYTVTIPDLPPGVYTLRYDYAGGVVPDTTCEMEYRVLFMQIPTVTLPPVATAPLPVVTILTTTTIAAVATTTTTTSTTTTTLAPTTTGATTTVPASTTTPEGPDPFSTATTLTESTGPVGPVAVGGQGSARGTGIATVVVLLTGAVVLVAVVLDWSIVNGRWRRNNEPPPPRLPPPPAPG
jgi:hypothetical protein